LFCFVSSLYVVMCVLICLDMISIPQIFDKVNPGVQRTQHMSGTSLYAYSWWSKGYPATLSDGGESRALNVTTHLWNNNMNFSLFIRCVNNSRPNLLFGSYCIYPAVTWWQVIFWRPDMRSGDFTGCCRGRLSKTSLQDHTPWALIWVATRATSRLTA